MSPVVEIYAPRRIGNNWAAAARIRLRGGTVEIVARAPQELVARELARLQALIAYRRLPEHEKTVGDIGDFFKAVGKGIGKVIRHPACKSLVNAAVQLVPYVGHYVAKSGVIDQALDATGKALGAKDKAKAARAIKAVKAQAARGVPRAQLAMRVGRDIARAAKEVSPDALQHARGLAKAGSLVRRARLGDLQAQRALVSVVRAARRGNPAAIKASGYLAVAMKLAQRAAEQQAEEPEELEPDDSDFDVTEELLDVGAALTAAELLRKIRALRAWRRAARLAMRYRP